MVPHVSGCEVLEQVKALPGNPDLGAPTLHDLLGHSEPDSLDFGNHPVIELFRLLEQTDHERWVGAAGPTHR